MRSNKKGVAQCHPPYVYPNGGHHTHQASDYSVWQTDAVILRGATHTLRPVTPSKLIQILRIRPCGLVEDQGRFSLRPYPAVA